METEGSEGAELWAAGELPASLAPGQVIVPSTTQASATAGSCGHAQVQGALLAD